MRKSSVICFGVLLWLSKLSHYLELLFQDAPMRLNTGLKPPINIKKFCERRASVGDNVSENTWTITFAPAYHWFCMPCFISSGFIFRCSFVYFDPKRVPQWDFAGVIIYSHPKPGPPAFCLFSLVLLVFWRASVCISFLCPFWFLILIFQSLGRF